MHEIGVHQVREFAGFVFNWDTIWTTWLAMAIVFLICYLATRNLKSLPTGWQNFLEMIVCYFATQMESTLGRRGRALVPIIIIFFLFILVSNWLGLLPTLTSPTNDLNTTLGLSITMAAIVHITGLTVKKTHYIKHFFQPYFPFVIVNVIEELAKPLTLAFRLFGNILAGEILIIILLMLMPVWFPFPSVIWLAFSIIVGIIQAFIFSMLSICFFSNAVKEDHHS